MKCFFCIDKVEDGYTVRLSGGRIVRTCETCWGVALVRNYYGEKRHVQRRGDWEPPKRKTG